MKLSYTRIIANFDFLNFIEISPKLSLVKNKIAVQLPLGLLFGSEGLGVILRPKINFTYPFSNKFDISVIPRFEYVLGDNKFFMNLTFGAGFSTNMKKWSLRPEVCIFPNPGYDVYGSIFIYGIGLNYNLSSNSK